MKILLISLSLMVVGLLWSAPAAATEEYAATTGMICSACHLDPAGGGELTAAGVAYLGSLAAGAATPALGTAHKLTRLAVGYLHILTSLFWFGTILYVHLVLKPAYAAQGLPKGEVLVGLGSMAVMAVTGTILALYRIGSLEMLLHSRFGILLLVKIALFLLMAGSALVVVLVIGPRLRNKQAVGRGAKSFDPKAGFSPAALALCDGQEGRPACFAYQGKVYEASASRLWKNGLHMGRHQAGTDLSEALKLAPHGEDKVTALPVMGPLINGAVPRPLPQRIFFFMAYMNLTMVFIITLILALWRWG